MIDFESLSDRGLIKQIKQKIINNPSKVIQSISVNIFASGIILSFDILNEIKCVHQHVIVSFDIL